MSDKAGPRPEMDMMRMLADFRMPAMPDLEALAAAQRRNLEALSQANRVALEGAQAIARRHMEIMQQAMSEMTQAIQHLSVQDSPQARAARQAEMMKGGYERAMANLKELADLIQKSNEEAVSVLTRRFSEAMDEVRSLASQQQGATGGPQRK